MKINNELNNMSWRVRPDEVLLEVGRLFGSKMGLQKLNYENFGVTSGRASIGSFTSLPPTQLFTTIGIYKGERVAIKKISKKKVRYLLLSTKKKNDGHKISFKLKKKVDITSTLLWEIKQARDVSHENTVRFVGSCIDLPCPTVLILTEYCPKGRIYILLEKKNVN